MVDKEISSVLPYVITAYNNGIYGLIIVVFIYILVTVFIYEIRLDIIKLDKKYIINLKIYIYI